MLRRMFTRNTEGLFFCAQQKNRSLTSDRVVKGELGKELLAGPGFSELLFGSVIH